MNQKKSLCFILINLFIFITTAIAVPVTLIVGSRASRLDDLGYPYWGHVVSFTILSNIFLGLIALIASIIGIIKLKNKSPLPTALTTWYLIASSSAMLTCITVLVFLAPMRAINGKNYFDMLLEPMFFLHFFNPILSAVAFIFFTGDQKIAKKPRFLAMLPLVVYTIPYVLCVAILKVWPDFYGVTFGGRYYLIPLVFVVFSLVIFGIATTLAISHNKYISRVEK